MTNLSTENKTIVFIRTSVYITQTLHHPPNLDSSPLSTTREETAVLKTTEVTSVLCAHFVHILWTEIKYRSSVTSLSVHLESEKFKFSVTAQRRAKLDELINRKQNHSLHKNLSLYYPDTPPPVEFEFKSIEYNQRKKLQS